MGLTFKAAAWHLGAGPGHALLHVTRTATASGVVVAVTEAGRGPVTCLIPKADELQS